MKGKLVRKLLSVTVALTMVLGMVGCGSDSKETTDDAAKSEATEASTQEAAGTEEASQDVAEGETVFDENGISGKGQLPISKENIELDVFVSQISYISDIDQNQTTITLQDETNVTLNLTMVPEENAKEKLNLMFMSGDYPDVIIGAYILTAADVITYGTEEGILIPLNDLIDDYCVNIQQRWEESPGLKEDMTSPDGNIYGIPSIDSSGRGHTDVGYKLWINTTWLDAVGLDMPTTTDEFRTVLEAFKNEDPNGNGIADEIAFTGTTYTDCALPYYNLINAFGYYNRNGVDGGYYLKDGEVQTMYDQDYLKDALEYISGLYADGLIDPAAFSQGDTELQAIGNDPDAVRIGVAAGTHLGVFMDNNDQERASQYEAMLPLEGPDGYNQIPYNKSLDAARYSFAITDKCENPEVAIKIMDLFCGEEWSVIGQVGEQGVEWDYADEGMVTALGEQATYKYLDSDRTSEEKTSYCWGWTWRAIEPAWKTMFAVEGDIRDPLNYEAFLLQQTEKFKPYAADVDVIPNLQMDADTATEFSTLTTMIDDYVDQAIVEFIVGDRDIEKDWDAYLADLERLGYYTEIQMVKDALAALN